MKRLALVVLLLINAALLYGAMSELVIAITGHPDIRSLIIILVSLGVSGAITRHVAKYW